MVNTLQPPPEVIASWPKPNYINPETRGDGLFAISIVLPALGILMVSARLYSRFFITKAPGFDDFLAVVAICMAIGLSTLIIIGNKYYFSGHHIWDIPPNKFVGHRQNVWVTQWLNVSALSCVKISVLLFYRRLSVTFSRPFMIATWIGIVYNIVYWVGFCLTLLLSCHPISAYWNKVNPIWANSHDWHCGSENIGLPVAGALSVLGDFYSAVLPMILITGLQLPRRQKGSLYALFAVAFLVVGAGIARTVLINITINRDYDFTWVLWECWIWVQVELYVALLAASAPALKPFFRRFFIEPISSTGGKRSNGYYGDQYADRVEMHAAKNQEFDPERIGIAYGGSGIIDTKSREEIFVRDVDDDAAETRRFELRQSGDGRRMIPMPVRRGKKGFSSSTRETEPVPSLQQQHTRNFSQPHSKTSSGDDTRVLLARTPSLRTEGPQQHIISQISPTRSPDPYSLGRDHVMRRLSQGSGSVRAARLRAQQEPNPPESQRGYMSHQRKLSQRREHLRPDFVAQRDSVGRGSRLDPPSSESEEISSSENERYRRRDMQEQGFDDPPFYQARGEMRDQMYIVGRPTQLHSISSRGVTTRHVVARELESDVSDDDETGGHARSSSDETLALPRMGSRDDFRTPTQNQYRSARGARGDEGRSDSAAGRSMGLRLHEMESGRRKEAMMNVERARIAMRETEREIERERRRG